MARPHWARLHIEYSYTLGHWALGHGLFVYSQNCTSFIDPYIICIAFSGSSENLQGLISTKRL